MFPVLVPQVLLSPQGDRLPYGRNKLGNIVSESLVFYMGMEINKEILTLFNVSYLVLLMS